MVSVRGRWPAWPGERGDGEVLAFAGPVLVGVTAVVCTIAWGLNPSGVIDPRWRWPVAVISAVLVALLVAARKRPGATKHAVAAMTASALIILAVVAANHSGDRASVLAVPIAVYAAYVLSRGAALGVVVVLGVGLAAALTVADVRAPILAWSLTMATVCSSAYAVRVLRRRLLRLLAQLGDDARRDHLTGILNRRGIDERLAEETLRALRSGDSLSVLVGDLDGFKGLNDRQGHAAGDRALRAVAEALQAATRTTDLVGRFGGDEFVVILPATDAIGAAESEARIRAELEQLVHDVAEPVSATFGAATFPADADSGQRLVAVADARLIARKRRRLRRDTPPRHVQRVGRNSGLEPA